MYIVTLSFKQAVVLGLTFDLQIGPVARDNENTSPATQSLIDDEIKRLLKVSYEEEEKRRGTLYWSYSGTPLKYMQWVAWDHCCVYSTVIIRIER